MALYPTKPEHEAFYQDLIALLRKHEHLHEMILLAIASNMLGKLLAMQDQTKFTSDQYMHIVAHNIERGNAQAIAEFKNTKPEGTS